MASNGANFLSRLSHDRVMPGSPPLEFYAKQVDLADVLENLASLYKDNGRYADASALFKRSMAIRAKAGSPS
jgi:Tetratricopeptide repeat